MTPEQEILSDQLSLVARTADSLVETRTLLPTMPEDPTRLDALRGKDGVFILALLRLVEQLEGALVGLFRAILRNMGINLKGLYPMDIGNRMVELHVIDDAGAWVAAVKLRDELVHEYPDDPDLRYTRVRGAYEAIPFLLDAAERAAACIAKRNLLP